VRDGGRPELRLVGGGAPEDPVMRRLRFEHAHPDAVILPPCAGRWRAVVPPGLLPGDGTRTTVGAWDLCDLMNQLEELYPGEDGPVSGSASKG
jgi:hypothetical protein